LDYADTQYAANPAAPVFVNTTTAHDAISQAVGGDGHTFYLKLTAGDQLFVWAQNGYPSHPLVQVKTGTAVLFFDDLNQDGEASADELVGLSLGQKSVVTVNGSVFGDVVANLSADGNSLLNGGDGLSATVGIKNLQIGANVSGRIMAGGPISNVTAQGIGEMLAGTAASGQSYNFFPGVGTAHTISFAATPGQAGASISSVFVNTTFGMGFEAGAGGAGAAGGSITNVKVIDDISAFSMIAGNGGNADTSVGKINGGKGGSISNVFFAGSPSSNSTPNLLAQFVAGDGGGGALTGTGGAGGAVSNLHVGYLQVGGKPFLAGNLISDVEIDGGAGGSGKIGGAGGAVTGITLQTVTQAHLNSGDPAHEIVVKGGAGGAATAATGAAGRGGSLSNLALLDIGIENNASILLHGGDAGAVTTTATVKGGVGGSISNVQLSAGDLNAIAGNGSTGKTGGVGGGLSKLTVAQIASVFTHTAEFDAGHGGDGAAGNAGAGGVISGIQISNSDLTGVTINAPGSGSGGNSTGGLGGAGGSVTAVNVLDTDQSGGTGIQLSGTFAVNGGTGGNGDKGGGRGGAITKLEFSSQDVSATLTSGTGGNALVAGNGGVGGAISNAHLAALFSSTLDPDSNLFAGFGGNGKGVKGAGGAGGTLSGIDVRTDGSADLVAGIGGSGDGGAAGAGGSILNTAAFATDGNGALIAGSAGSTGGKGAAGGSVMGTSTAKLAGLYAAGNLTVQAGDGHLGGAGGSIKFVGYGSTSASLTPTPTGNIVLQAGNGSFNSNTAGAGGSISNVSGCATSMDGTSTTITAGNGAGNGTVSSAGGSITNLIIQRGGFTANGDPLDQYSAIMTIQAGDAGASGGKIGAKGGSVSGVAVSDIGAVLLRSVGAGDGGNGSVTGGTGGSITNFSILGSTTDSFGNPLPPGTILPGDIGQREGATFGYGSMGGIFAGLGGTGGTPGLAGSVSGIAADSIASIVAGRGTVPQEVTSVSHVLLNGFHLLHASLGALDRHPDGLGGTSYSFNAAYYAQANFVGATADPNRTNPNAFVFEYNGTQTGNFTLGDIPTDGIVMTLKLDQSTLNFTPEASLVGSVFFDYSNNLV